MDYYLNKKELIEFKIKNKGLCLFICFTFND
jgi:hypothetical protein